MRKRPESLKDREKLRNILESETPDDDVYLLTDDGDVLWTDNALDADKVEKEIEDCTKK